MLWPPIWTAATACAQALLTGLGWMAQWPGAVATFAQPPLGLGLLGMLGCAWLLVRWPGGVRWLGLSLVLPLLLWQPPRPKPGEFSLLALDIGQGSSLLLQTAQHALLVDAGPRWASGDAGSQSIVPLLQALGVRLDRVLLTHADSDHTGGALSVLAAQPQADLLGSGIAALADQAQRPWQPCARGQQWAWDGVHFSVLWPAPATVKAANHNNTNAQSCVLLVRSAHGATALLAGDLERAQEHALLALHAGQSRDLQAHALVVAHHGSQTSTSAPWLAAVQPQVALIQSGWRNRFGHPAAAGGAAPDGGPSPDFQHRPVWCDRLAILPPRPSPVRAPAPAALLANTAASHPHRAGAKHNRPGVNTPGLPSNKTKVIAVSA